ncbi:hypothetical protein [Parvularcula sp. IMCC14364]|uniref:hypothetical protein n=1 Tax=Parvularcula sp. IMCC14364 TaxID=3067902 RepID=UPI002740D043|nr:hypothetical protein [Parvularcula sp. IMCC14364]
MHKQINQLNWVQTLVYTYFDNLTELLKELLEQELRSLRRLQFQAAESAETFEDLVRSVTHQYLAYIAQRGLLIERLQSEPSISRDHDPTDFGRDAAVTYLAKIVSRHFDLPIEVARAATDISFGLPASAGIYFLRSKANLKEVEDLTVKMIMGSILAVVNDRLKNKITLKQT